MLHEGFLRRLLAMHHHRQARHALEAKNTDFRIVAILAVCQRRSDTRDEEIDRMTRVLACSNASAAVRVTGFR